MSMDYTDSAQTAIDLAKQYSKEMRHGYVGTEHILVGLLQENVGVAAKVLFANEVETDRIIGLIDDQIAPDSKVALRERDGLSPKTQEILALSEEVAQSFGSKKIGTEHLLIALIQDGDNLAIRLLNTLGVNIQKVYVDILLAMGENIEQYKQQLKRAQKNSRAQGAELMIDKYSRDLTKLAKEGKLSNIVGRDAEITRMIQTLSRKTKNNPCLIGEPGVGKTALVEGLAQKIVRNEVPASVADKRVLSLDLSAIVAGSKYRGEFEERIKKVISEVISEGNILLFMDEVHTIIGAGGAEGSIDASNILKPSLARGELQLIGATTYDEYRKHIRKDAALERRFQPIYVEEPSFDECVAILKGIRKEYEEHHNVVYEDEALVQAVALSQKYIADRFLPDKAIDLMDEAAAKVRLSHTGGSTDKEKDELTDLLARQEAALKKGDIAAFSELKNTYNTLKKKYEKSRTRAAKSGKSLVPVVTENDMASVVEEWTKIPAKRLTESEGSKLQKLEKELGKSVIGQSEAISAVARAIKRGRVGLSDGNRPIGSFLFLGPTGVGKTELTKTLAKALFGTENALIRVDMSEYMEKHTVSKMIGSPPGYVGYEEGGQLSEKVRRNPYSVVLFDEIEKAHPDVFNILLQILDDGHVTDSSGRKVSFKNTIIIMTSNAGANRIVDPKYLGFATQTDEKSDHERMKSGVMEEVKKIFRPEFLNRIDEIIVFRSLSESDMQQIVSLQTDMLAKRALSEHDIMLSVSAPAKKLIAEKGTDKKYGARPLKRAVQTMVEDELAYRILSGEINDGDRVKISVRNGILTFETY